MSGSETCELKNCRRHNFTNPAHILASESLIILLTWYSEKGLRIIGKP